MIKRITVATITERKWLAVFEGYLPGTASQNLIYGEIENEQI